MLRLRASIRSLKRCLSTHATLPGVLALEQDGAAGGSGPVMLVEFLRGMSLAEADSAAAGAEVLADLTPHATHSVLLGDAKRHAFDRIVWRRFPCASSAHSAVVELAAAVGSNSCLVLRVNEVAGFAALSLSEASENSGAPHDTVPAAGAGAPSPAPFVADPSSHPAAWAALHEEPSPGRMVAMNMLRMAEGTPVPARYAQYAAHFAELPARYGLAVRAVAEVPPPARSVVLGELGPGAAGYTMLAAVDFPSSRVFESCWSDDDIHRAFPLREQMWQDGFEHVWLRCDE